MTKKSNMRRILSLTLAVAAIGFAGSLFEANAQRDPFAKPGYARPRPQVPAGAKVDKDGKPITSDWSAIPSIEQRIDYYKRLRAAAAANGSPLPKVTSVLTLNEMAVTGIFRTPRGYAAMVEAVPIKLSYTIYPGEKFFDGQLVAVEENQLVFRRVVKTGKDKFVSSVENKQLRRYSDRETIQGTAPSDSRTAAVSAGSSAPAAIVSPVDEMNKQAPAGDSGSAKDAAKKPAKVASNK